MVTHSSILAWRTPWTEEPGGLQSVGSQESDLTEHSQTCRQAGQEAVNFCNSCLSLTTCIFWFPLSFITALFSCLHEMIFFIKEHSGPHSLWQETPIQTHPLPLTCHGAHRLPGAGPWLRLCSGASLSCSSQNKSHDHTADGRTLEYRRHRQGQPPCCEFYGLRSPHLPASSFFKRLEATTSDVTCSLDKKPETRLNIGLSHGHSARSQTLPSPFTMVK